MVNKTQFHKTKIAMAVVVSLGLAACGDDGSTTTGAENSITQQQQQTGTVQGVVVDTNGNPIEGAAVFLGAAETVTNAGGQYVFTDVAVVSVNGVNNEGDESDDDLNQTLVITIVGTDEYLGALVTVTPESQVNNTGGQSDDGSNQGQNSLVTAQTFVDGFTAEADIAVLPMLNAGAYGYIRHCETGQPLLSAADLLSLDFVTINADADDNIDDDQITNAEDNHAISSDENGMFSLTNLAANSSYTITPKKGWTITSGSTSVSTGSEDSSEFLGTIEVCPVEFVEADVTVAPWIKSIDGQIGTSTVGVVDAGVIETEFPAGTDVDAEYAALNQGVVNDFVINFSEEMASTFNLAEARVKVIAPGETLSETVADATVTLAADGKSATVTFVTDLAEGSKVDVWFPHWTALDANDDLFLVDNGTIKYDAIEVAVSGAAKSVYSHAYFCTFAKPSDIASVVLGPQVIDAETTEDGNSTDLSDYSTAFQDNFEESAGVAITQLNDGDADSATRLTALATARGETVTIDQDYAVVSFDGSNAASLVWMLNDVVVTTGVIGGALGGDGVDIATDALGVTTVHVTPAAHNDVLTATPVNGFGDVITAGTMSVTLVDAIAPTTVLQESYNITDVTGPRAGFDLVSGVTANAAFGNGGEISLAGDVGTSVGNPIIHIQPRHLAGLNTGGTAARTEEFDTLTTNMSDRLSDAEKLALGVGAATALSQSTIAGFDMPVYDATAFAGWASIPATIGVAFNEDVTLTAVAPVFDGSTSLSGYSALNNVAANIDGDVVAVDLVTFETPDVLALSLDAGADLAFVGSVTDSRANTSTANAQVFIQDTFPPMMTASVWDGETLELTFNEPVVIPTTGTTVTIIDPETTTNSVDIPVTTTNSSVSGNVLSITLTGGENTAVAPLFVDGANTEFLYDDNGNAANEQQHALIDWDDIADATGNEWSEFTPLARGMEVVPGTGDVNRWEVVAPRFLAVNAVGAFTYSVATAGYDNAGAPVGGDDDGNVTFTITFTHPIDMNVGPTVPNAFADAIDTADGIATPGDGLPITVLSYSTANAAGAAVLNALFVMDLDGGGVSPEDAFNTGVVTATNTNGSLLIGNGNTTLTLSVSADVESIIFGTSTFGFQTTVKSAINGLETSAGNFNWQNNN